MSYVLSPVGANQTPWTASVDAAGYDLEDAGEIQVDSLTPSGSGGMEIGDSASDKIGFYGVTPIVQPSALSGPAIDPVNVEATLVSIGNFCEAVKTFLNNTGLTA